MGRTKQIKQMSETKTILLNYQWNNMIVAVVKNVISPFLCWKDAFTLSWTCRTFRQTCRPFAEDFYRLIEESTDLKKQDVEHAIRQGVCCSGSLVHQAMFGVRYNVPIKDVDDAKEKEIRRIRLVVNQEARATLRAGINGDENDEEIERKETKETVAKNYLFTDSDWYYLAEKRADNMRQAKGIRGPQPSRMLRPVHPDYVTLVSGMSKDKQSNIQSEDYDNFLPVFCEKFGVFPVGVIRRLKANGRDDFQLDIDQNEYNRTYTPNTIIDLVGIKRHDSVAEFLDEFVDMSHCKVYFGMGDGSGVKEYEESTQHVETQTRDIFHGDTQTTIRVTTQVTTTTTRTIRSKPKLYFKNWRHIQEGCFEMNWDLGRYFKTRDIEWMNDPLLDLKLWQNRKFTIQTMARRLVDRCDKYQSRGFICSNNKVCSVKQYIKEQMDLWLGECPELTPNEGAEDDDSDISPRERT